MNSRKCIIIIAIIWPLVILWSIISIDDHFVKLHSLFTVSFNSVKSISKLWTRLRTEGCPATLFIQNKLFDPKFSKLSYWTEASTLTQLFRTICWLELKPRRGGSKVNYSPINGTEWLTASDKVDSSILVERSMNVISACLMGEIQVLPFLMQFHSVAVENIDEYSAFPGAKWKIFQPFSKMFFLLNLLKIIAFWLQSWSC